MSESKMNLSLDIPYVSYARFLRYPHALSDKSLLLFQELVITNKPAAALSGLKRVNRR